MVGRSRTGCLTCRARKTKCDEQRPICGQCLKANRECTPSTGIVFRHQQNASMNQSENPEDDSLQSFYAYKNTFDKHNVWVKTPQRLSFIVNADPYAEADPDDPEATPSHQLEFPSETFQHRGSAASEGSTKLPELNSLSNSTTGNDDPKSLPPISSLAPAQSRRETSARSSEALKTLSSPSGQSPRSSTTSAFPPASNNLQFILNPSSAVSPPAHTISDRTSSRYSRQSNDAQVETDHELIFLIRHFSETLGPWMDLFDLGLYFTNHVPIKVLTNPLLKNAAAAYAAKQLGRMKGRKFPMGGFGTRLAYSELYQDIHTIDWQHKAPYYYDKAINLLIQAIKDGRLNGQNDTINSPLEAPSPFRVTDLHGVQGEHRGSFNSQSPSVTSGPSSGSRRWRKASSGPYLSDEMAAATVILCDYEILGGSRDNWSRHLYGAKELLSSSGQNSLDRRIPFDKLFDIVEGNVMPLQTPCIVPSRNISRARQATFWNFARQDWLWAFMKESQTKLDTDDMSMWRDAGLMIKDDGYVKLSNFAETGLPEGDCMQEDMISNALIWIMAKIVNYCNKSAGSPATDLGPSDSGTQAMARDTWCRLDSELDFWYKGLPDSFRPSAKISSRDFPEKLPDGRRSEVFSEVWYNIGMCASAMQSYSMARILMLLHQPSSVGQAPIFKRFGAYKSITADILGHARNICGIAAARPQNAVRIHAVQPLFTAGQCLETYEERAEVIHLLQDIEHDTGWATEYRVQQLYMYWKCDDIKSETS